jgi:hypothetical protein
MVRTGEGTPPLAGNGRTLMALDDTAITTVRTAIIDLDRQLRDLERAATGHSERSLVNRIRGTMSSALDALTDLHDVSTQVIR